MTKLKILILLLLVSQVDAATVTSYCRNCDHSGITRSGKHLSTKYCAADPHYWKPGTVLHFGPPLNRNYIVEDTGGAIHGKYRFDIYQNSSGRCRCNKFGVKHITVTVVHRSKRHW
jgi:3D (Asp-Asp-Asp) domain-containing protein